MIFCIKFFQTTYCSSHQKSLIPYTYPLRALSQYDIYPDIKTISLPAYDRTGVCYNYALQKILNFSPEQVKELQSCIVGGSDWITILNILNYFQQIKTAETNCLALYVFDKNIQKPCHAAYMVSRQIALSKKGSLDQIIEHHPQQSIEDMYGNKVSYWKLQSVYDTTEGKLKLLNILIHTAQASPTMDAYKLKYIDNFLHYIKIYDLQKAKNVLKRAMCIDINLMTKKNETLLMLLAQYSKKNFVELCLMFGANSNIQRNDGKIAIEIALENKKYKNAFSLFMHSIAHNDIEQVKLYLDSNGTIDFYHNDDKSAISLALKKELHSIVYLLLIHAIVKGEIQPIQFCLKKNKLDSIFNETEKSIIRSTIKKKEQESPVLLSETYGDFHYQRDCYIKNFYKTLTYLEDSLKTI